MAKSIVKSFGSNRDSLVPHLAAVLLCALALVRGIQTTGDLSWPYDLDQFREIGIAQSILDHRYGTDHLYAGETLWYNPLTSIVTAGLSRLTGVPVYLVVTRAGAYLNLFGPIAFYILVAYLFDRWTALAALAAFFFAPIGDAPGWVAATYSPWLFSPNFAQGFFYLSLASFAKSLGSRSWRWSALTGILLGLTFLTHTAPAVLFGVIVLVTALRDSIPRQSGDRFFLLGMNELKRLAIIFSIAFVVSLPFTVSILFHYHLHVVNTVPSNWVYPSLALSNLPTALRTFLSFFALIALVGLVNVIRSGPDRHRRILLLTWLIVCCLALALNEFQQFRNLRLMFVPAHHFLFYLRAVEDILFGVGLVFICRAGVELVRKILAKSAVPPERERPQVWIERSVIGAGILCFVLFVLPSYSKQFDYTTARDEAIGFEARKDYFEAYRWILANTKPESVFLSLTGDLDLSIVGPADRKTVVTCQAEFSNPYVSWRSRAETARAIVDKLAEAAPDARSALSAAHVDYIITAPMDRFDQPPFSFLFKDFAEGNIVIYRVTAD